MPGNARSEHPPEETDGRDGGSGRRSSARGSGIPGAYEAQPWIPVSRRVGEFEILPPISTPLGEGSTNRRSALSGTLVRI
jgi:hypothetical protein